MGSPARRRWDGIAGTNFASRVDDATVRSIADAMAGNGMKEAGYLYINIDDTWEGGRDAQGISRPTKNFPT